MVNAKKLVQIWLVGAFICWVGITAVFGASADPANINARKEMLAVLFYIPVLSLLWPIWTYFLFGKSESKRLVNRAGKITGFWLYK